MSISFDTVLQVSDDVMARTVGDEAVFLDLKRERYLGLDDVSSRMWEALTAGVTIESAYQTLLAEFDVEPERLRADLEEFVQELATTGLVQSEEA